MEQCESSSWSYEFRVSHIYREGNHIADALANQGLSKNSLEVWNAIPSDIRSLFVKDRLGLPNYRFISF
jgi:hypothetical protein